MNFTSRAHIPRRTAAPTTARRRGCQLAVGLVLALVLSQPAHAGSTAPDLAIADGVATVDGGVVTVEVTGNFDYGNVVRLGYPLAIVVTAGSTVARLGLDGSVTVAVDGNAPAPVAGAPGVIAIAPARLTAVLPPAIATEGAASVRLEATFDGGTLRSNAVQVQW